MKKTVVPGAAAVGWRPPGRLCRLAGATGFALLLAGCARPSVPRPCLEAAAQEAPALPPPPSAIPVDLDVVHDRSRSVPEAFVEKVIDSLASEIASAPDYGWPGLELSVHSIRTRSNSADAVDLDRTIMPAVPPRPAEVTPPSTPDVCPFATPTASATPDPAASALSESRGKAEAAAQALRKIPLGPRLSFSDIGGALHLQAELIKDSLQPPLLIWITDFQLDLPDRDETLPSADFRRGVVHVFLWCPDKFYKCEDRKQHWKRYFLEHNAGSVDFPHGSRLPPGLLRAFVREQPSASPEGAS